MRYWIITKEFPPAYGGGIGTYCYHAAKMLQQNGWDVSVFIGGTNVQKDNVQFREGIRIIEFANRSGAWNILGYDAALSYEFGEIIRTYLEREGLPDVIESQEYAGIAYYILQYKHLNYPLFKDLKVLLTLHAPSFLYNDYNRVPRYQLPYFWTSEMERWCMQAADMLNAPSQFMADAVQSYFQYSTLEKEIHIIPYPFNFDFSKAVKKGDPREDWFFFGKLTPQKGIIQLLSAFRQLFKQGWDKKLQLIGGGDHYYHPENLSITEWIKKEYKTELASGKVELHGNLSPQKWARLTERGGVVIIPSIGDNYPFTVMESIGNGQVVLASSQGGQRELIDDGKNGFLFDHTKPGDLVEKVKKISSLPVKEIEKIQNNGPQSVLEKHSYEIVFQQKSFLLKKLLDQPHQKNCYPFIRELKISEKFIAPALEVNNDSLSVVISYYNMGKYVEETILSIRQSDYNPIELIVVNDGSTDSESIRIINELQKKYAFILIDQRNQGLAGARNTGAQKATGEFLAFVDADDKIHATYYSKAVKILREKDNVSFVGSWVQFFGDSKDIWPAFAPELPYILYYNTVCSGALVYKKEDFLRAGLNDKTLEYGLEDWESVINMIKNGYRGVVFPEILYYYRIRKGSMARKFTDEKMLYSINYITQKHQQLYSTFAADLSGLLHANGPGFKINNPTLDYKKYGKLTYRYPVIRKMADLVKRNPFLKKIAFKIYALVKK